ncbi:hypothetical protein B14911_10532 [Bacillus sp. NRRL B-14911]|nr:hypothetical protein B14911_10532 [Bacillus sp. NRRL B-14911]
MITSKQVNLAGWVFIGLAAINTIVFAAIQIIK